MFSAGRGNLFFGGSIDKLHPLGDTKAPMRDGGHWEIPPARGSVKILL
jgi:hypothetical protein